MAEVLYHIHEASRISKRPGRLIFKLVYVLRTSTWIDHKRFSRPSALEKQDRFNQHISRVKDVKGKGYRSIVPGGTKIGRRTRDAQGKVGEEREYGEVRHPYGVWSKGGGGWYIHTRHCEFR